MNVDFNEIVNFKLNFDNCDTYMQVRDIINEIEDSPDHPFLAMLKEANRFYGKLRVAAVYRNGQLKICDKDDLNVLIQNFPKEWTK